jgi:hypothetical protein
VGLSAFLVGGVVSLGFFVCESIRLIRVCRLLTCNCIKV